MMPLKIIPTDTPPRDLLLLADESEVSVADYIGRGRCFVAVQNDTVVGEYVLLHTRPFTVEIVNLAVAPDYQRRGIGTALLHHAITTARGADFHLLEIGTGETGTGQIALYEQCGFVRCGVDRDYFIKHYPQPIVEDGRSCRDMVRLRMELQ